MASLTTGAWSSRSSRSAVRAALALVIVAALSQHARLSAQSAQELVIHLWVDPRNGDDLLAMGAGSLNPDGANTVAMEPLCFQAPCACTNPCQPTGLRPNDIVDAAQTALINAPYPFKTLTAAVRYINEIPSRSGAAPGTKPLPYTSPSTGFVWKHAIIHLLSGLYASPLPASWVAQFGPHHPDNGLVANGETFPIRLPSHVTVQGTNALNTFFDLRGQTAFEFGVFIDPATGFTVAASDPAAVPVDGDGCCISRVTFYGGGSSTPPYSGAVGFKYGAIVIKEETSAKPSFTNCFFVRNRVGVIINSSPSATGTGGVPDIQHNGTTFVNNTFAWNGVGLWNGEGARAVLTDRQNVPVVFGWSRLNLISNVFDTYPTWPVGGGYPTLPCAHNGQFPQQVFTSPSRSQNLGGWPWATGLGQPDSAFEGVCSADMRTLIPGTSPGQFEDCNAYERWSDGTSAIERYNLRSPSSGWSSGIILTNAPLPLALPRPGTSNPIPEPLLELHVYTGFRSVGTSDSIRGILYVNDLICAGAADVTAPFPAPATGPNGGFDLSPHDFRLAPSAARRTEPASTFLGLEPNDMNPLVDRGYGGGWPATMLNGQLVEVPGKVNLSAASAHRWQHDEWESDCEGYGNSRVHDHPIYTNAVGRPANWEWVDVGADELAEQIDGGYRFGTTSYIRLPIGHSATPRFWSASLVLVPTPFANDKTFYLGPVTTPDASRPLLAPGTFSSAFQNDTPRFRILAALTSATADFPPAYRRVNQQDPTEAGCTWHSVEHMMQDGQDVNYLRWWRFDPASLLTSNMVPSCPSSPSGASWYTIYQATPADVTPHLIPDMHPWWSVQFQPWASYFFPTSNVLWQPCLSGLETNLSLYDRVPSASIASVANPPGSFVGYTAGPENFMWLDGTSLSGSSPQFFQFRHWRSQAPGVTSRLSSFDSFCRGIIAYVGTGAPAPEPYHTLPSTHPLNQSPPTEPVAVRFSTEWSLTGPFSTARNLQSFLVLIHD